MTGARFRSERWNSAYERWSEVVPAAVAIKQVAWERSCVVRRALASGIDIGTIAASEGISRTLVRMYSVQAPAIETPIDQYFDDRSDVWTLAFGESRTRRNPPAKKHHRELSTQRRAAQKMARILRKECDHDAEILSALAILVFDEISFISSLGYRDRGKMVRAFCDSIQKMTRTKA